MGFSLPRLQEFKLWWWWGVFSENPECCFQKTWWCILGVRVAETTVVFPNMARKWSGVSTSPSHTIQGPEATEGIMKPVGLRAGDGGERGGGTSSPSLRWLNRGRGNRNAMVSGQEGDFPRLGRGGGLGLGRLFPGGNVSQGHWLPPVSGTPGTAKFSSLSSARGCRSALSGGH